MGRCMIGHVDESGRAILRIRLRNPTTGNESDVEAWIDTGFTGDLTISSALAKRLGLPPGPKVRASLADGSVVVLESRLCEPDWFGNWRSIELIACDGEDPLLGFGLLRGHELSINYRTMTLRID
jgi:clan AA aspartic protease